MKRTLPHFSLLTSSFLLLTFHFLLPSASAQPPAMINYQGRLVDGVDLVNGTVAMYLRLYDAPVGGTLLYTDANSMVPVVDGLFSTFIGDDTDFGNLDQALTNEQVWLEIEVESVILTPRERLVSVPYARAVHGLYIRPDIQSVTLNPAAGTNIAHASFSVVSGGAGNLALGNYSTVGGGSGNRASLWFATVGGGAENLVHISYGTIGGGRTNVVLGDYGTVAGGWKNVASEQFATVGGGQTNVAGGLQSTVGGGNQNSALGLSAYVGGGEYNRASGWGGAVAGGGENVAATNWATVAGGFDNRASAIAAAIGGGSGNRASGLYSTIAGGWLNSARGSYAMIPGGRNNSATNLAFAAGRRAKADHSGAFVWADNTDADFSSTATNQFLVRAGGGVGINTNNPQAALHVAGEAMIGSNPQPATFGMQRVNAASSGTLFIHPDTDVVMSWTTGSRTLAVSNGSPYFVQVSISLLRPGSADVEFTMADIASGSVIQLANPVADAASWSVQFGRDDQPYGFMFQGTGFENTINGLVTYWK